MTPLVLGSMRIDAEQRLWREKRKGFIKALQHLPRRHPIAQDGRFPIERAPEPPEAIPGNVVFLDEWKASRRR